MISTLLDVRVNCPKCGRPAAKFTVDPSDGVLRPTMSTELLPAGRNGRPDEFRWRMQCETQRCNIERVVMGATLSERTERALRAGRYRKYRTQISGAEKAATRRSIQRGYLSGWEEARQRRATRYLVVLVLGEDL